MANLHLSFETNTVSGTILRVKQQQPPWRVVRGFKAPSGELLAHVHNVSGGILDTDSLDWRIDVAPGAQAQVTSTGATRIYRSRAPERIALAASSAERRRKRISGVPAGSINPLHWFPVRSKHARRTGRGGASDDFVGSDRPGTRGVGRNVSAMNHWHPLLNCLLKASRSRSSAGPSLRYFAA